MTEESYTYSQAKTRLDDIVAQVRKKDVSLEKSLDLLEEGVRLANQCTELIDQAEWESLVETPDTEELGADSGANSGDDSGADDSQVFAEDDSDYLETDPESDSES